MARLVVMYSGYIHNDQAGKFTSPMLYQLNYEVKSVLGVLIRELQGNFSACQVWIYTQSNITITCNSGVL